MIHSRISRMKLRTRTTDERRWKRILSGDLSHPCSSVFICGSSSDSCCNWFDEDFHATEIGRVSQSVHGPTGHQRADVAAAVDRPGGDAEGGRARVLHG